jgi:hypothetical protein
MVGIRTISYTHDRVVQVSWQLQSKGTKTVLKTVKFYKYMQEETGQNLEYLTGGND